MCVAVRREHFENAFAEFEDGNVERSAPEVVHGDSPLPSLLQTVGQRCGGWFIDDAQDVEPCDTPRIFRGLTLSIIEVRGNGDDSVDYFFAEGLLRVLFQFSKNKCGNLRRRIFASEDFQ